MGCGCQLLLVSITLIISLESMGAFSSTFTITNNCSYTVWPGIQTTAGTAVLATTGFSLNKGESRILDVPAAWSGHLWGRTLCTTDTTTGNFTCGTGDCGSNNIECSGGKIAPPATLAEFALAGFDNKDFYDVSLVEGYNLPMVVMPQDVGGSNCTTIGCPVQLNGACPAELKVVMSNKSVACKSACDAFGSPQYCCTGAYATQNPCKPTVYSEFFKKACPRAYSYADDDATFTCSSGVGYNITFCPSTRYSVTMTPPPPSLVAPAMTPPPSSLVAPAPVMASLSAPAPPGGKRKSSSSKIAIFFGPVLGSILLGILLYILWWILKRKDARRGQLNSFGWRSNMDLPFFDLAIIQAATSYFSDENKLGEGGFGPVYMGTLRDGRKIAVKRLSTMSHQGVSEFKNEMKLIAKLQHKNLVRVLGGCVEKGEKLIIYEYLPNKSLDAFLSDEKKRSELDWTRRLHIIDGIARGLLYLHQDSRPKVIHRDLKPSNILLDDAMNPKISDFGISKIIGADETEVNTGRRVGTFGYMAPEYAMDGIFSEKSDVYSFGVLLLEILSGQKNGGLHFEQHGQTLPRRAWQLWREDRATELVDRLLVDSYTPAEAIKVIHIGLLCVQENVEERPTMPSVVVMLWSEQMVPPQPTQPPIFSRPAQRPIFSRQKTLKSINEVTNSDITPR